MITVKMTGHLEEDGLEVCDLVDLAQLLLLLTVGFMVSFSSWQILVKSILTPQLKLSPLKSDGVSKFKLRFSQLQCVSPFYGLESQIMTLSHKFRKKSDFFRSLLFYTTFS